MYGEVAEIFGKDAELQLIREAEQTSMIVLVGATGAGKSFFINAVAPGSCATSSRLASCKFRLYSLMQSNTFRYTKARSSRCDV